MDESIKCECGNDKFWWFEDFVRCPECHNEYKITTAHSVSVSEYWMRRFNKEENCYNENWEHFKSGQPGYSWSDHMEKQIELGNITEEQFQQINDKGLESLKGSIVGDPVDLGENWIEQNLDHSIDPPLSDAEYERIHSKDDSIVENAVKTINDHPYITGSWRHFWDDRWFFECQMSIFLKRGNFVHPGSQAAIIERWGYQVK